MAKENNNLLPVDIWTIDVAPGNECLMAVEKEVLSREELEQAARFRFPEDAKRFLFRRRTLRKILCRYVHQPPREIVFSINKNGKPRIDINEKGAEDWEFNFSHSRDLALLALVRGEEVGIDVEYALKPMPDLYEVLEVVCRPSEVRQFKDLPKAWHQRAFFKLWTTKEAYLKALGTGLSREPDTVHLRIIQGDEDVLMALDDPQEKGWQFLAFEPRPGYFATLALQTEKQIKISRFCFSDQVTGSMGR